MGDSVSRLMTQVQYIAPLMAYFNPEINETASVYYYDDGTYIVQLFTSPILLQSIAVNLFWTCLDLSGLSVCLSVCLSIYLSVSLSVSCL